MTRSYLNRASLMLAIFLMSSFLRASAQDVEVSYQTFYDELSPYGQWVYDGEYGNVFVPNVESEFRPYGNDGHWVMTDNGNMWVSDYNWGWACFHYGRWTYNPYYGWVWIPGYEWAPAWVSWRSGGGYYGWAPMGPGCVAGNVYDYPENYWVFVGPQYLYHHSVYSYYEPRYTTVFITGTSYIHETYYDRGSRYCYGPRREVIERETHRPVQVYRVNNVRTPGDCGVARREVNIYRPAVNRASVNTARPSYVVRGEQAVGRPQAYSVGHRQSEYHQTVQRTAPGRNNYNERPQDRPNHYDRPAPQQQYNQPQHNDRPVRQEYNHPANNDRPVRQEYNQPQHNDRPVRQEYNQPAHNDRPAPQQYNQPQHNDRPVRQEYNQPHNDRPAPLQYNQPTRNDRPAPQQYNQPTRNENHYQQANSPQPRPQQAPAPQHNQPAQQPTHNSSPANRAQQNNNTSGRR